MADLPDDPWRADVPPVHTPSTPRPASRKGKEPEGRGVWEGLGTMQRLNVLSAVVDSSNGRDKVLKSCQYAAKTYTYLFLITQTSLLRRKDSPEHVRRLESAAGSLSLARKCLRLFGPIPHFNKLVQADPLPPATCFNTILALLTASADDVYCLSKLGLVGTRTGRWADKWANRFWFLKSVIELLKLGIRRIVLRAFFPRRRVPPPEVDVDAWERERQELWSARKVCCDVVFSGYNVFRVQRFKEPVQTFTGLAAGLISASQLFRKEEVKLFKALH